MILFVFSACVSAFAETANQLAYEPIDKNRTPETLTLYQHLIQLSDMQGFAFGNQGEYHSGIGWPKKGDVGIHESDLHSVLGVQGGVSGYNVNWILKSDHTADLDAENKLQQEMRTAYRNGAIITFHWPMDNPLTLINDNTCGDECAHLIDEVLEKQVFSDVGTRGKYYDRWVEWMDVFVDFVKNKAVLDDQQHTTIPILFRPWHEMNLGEGGQGKWYQIAYNSETEYRALWKQTVDYLIKKEVHQLLYVYAPSLNGLNCSDCQNSRADRYIANYPGDEYVDIMAGDCYFSGFTQDSSRFNNLSEGIKIIVDTAINRKKIPALAETGFKDGLQNDTANAFWYKQWLNKLKYAAPAKLPKLAYVMTWTNTDSNEGPKYYVPHSAAASGQIDDFKRFKEDTYTLFGDDLKMLWGIP
jgi:mannan endo-1,4-beta-mannosidase